MSDPHLSQVEYRIARRPKSVEKIPEGFAREYERMLERRKASLRSTVEHPFQIVKQFFGYSKVVYRGLAKNLNRLHVLFSEVPEEKRRIPVCERQ